MTKPRHRSRTFRRVKVRTPAGKSILHYRPRKASKQKCKDCGIVLKGVPHNTSKKLKKFSKSQKRPQRPYGGILCTRCMRKLMIIKTKEMVMKND